MKVTYKKANLLLKQNHKQLCTRRKLKNLPYEDLGDDVLGTYQHDVVRFTLENKGYRLETIQNKDWPIMFEDTTHQYMIEGALNYNFRPWYFKNNKVIFRESNCAIYNFGGNGRLNKAGQPVKKGDKAEEEEEHSYHSILLSDKKIFCINLVSEDKLTYFQIDGKICLPLLRSKSKDPTQYYSVSSTNMLSYLSLIRRVYKLIPPKKKSSKGKNS